VAHWEAVVVEVPARTITAHTFLSHPLLTDMECDRLEAIVSPRPPLLCFSFNLPHVAFAYTQAAYLDQGLGLHGGGNWTIQKGADFPLQPNG
jgi:hypothetical protein